ncbi:MAG: ABC transporter substrate-binding protein [Pseudolabrys sp.]
MMRLKIIVIAALATVSLRPALAEDAMKIAVGQRGNWNMMISDLGQAKGIFKKNDITLDILYTAGGGETQQAVISNSVDVGIGIGTLQALGAYAKGAPIRIIGAESTGAADFWYARTELGLDSLKNAKPETTIAYSTNGASTHSMALGFVKEYGLKSKLVATGNPSATFTAVMSGQVDVGWSSPPLGLAALQENKTRIVARANDLPNMRNETIRVIAVNAQKLTAKPELFQRFMKAYRETLDWAYSSDEALQIYAAMANVSVPVARQVRDEFFAIPALNPDQIKGLERQMQDGVTFKHLTAPLSEQQLADLIRIPPRQ